MGGLLCDSDGTVISTFSGPADLCGANDAEALVLNVGRLCGWIVANELQCRKIPSLFKVASR